MVNHLSFLSVMELIITMETFLIDELSNSITASICGLLIF